MLNCKIIKDDKLTMENLNKLSDDIVSNKKLDNDINTHNYEDMELFDLEHHAINRHDRRVIKSKYRKLNKRRNGRKL